MYKYKLTYKPVYTLNNMNTESDPVRIKLSEKELLSRMYRYCAFQERSEKEARLKLQELNANPVILNKITNRLKEEGFLNEDRFIRTYVLGKLRNKYWGKIKIKQGLKERSIDEDAIEKHMAVIEESEYLEIIGKLIRKKKELIRDQDIFIIKNKVAKYLLSKGFEADVIWDQIHKAHDGQ